MRVFVSDIVVRTDKDGDDYWLVVGSLQSGMEIIVKDMYFDIRRYVGQRVDMLLSFLRSPYSELQRGIQSPYFLPFKYYSVELIDELLEEKGVVSTGNKRVVVLSGEYIDSYALPAKWATLTQRDLFKMLYKEPSALKTGDGAFLLYPWHLKKKVPLEQIPREVTMVGTVNLEAWKPSR